MRRLGIAGSALLALGVAATAAAAGSAWKVQRSPNPSGAMYSPLNGVSCPSRSACTAVGYYTKDFTVYSTLAQHWNGTKWSIQSTPALGGTYGSLNAVSCAMPQACVAVGDYESSGEYLVLAERFNAGKWSVLHPSNPAGASGSSFHGVSCISARDCTAVGDYTSGGVDQTLAERWNGKAWSIEDTPNPAGADLSYLSSVSCTSRGACEAVGHYRNASAVYKTLVERWNGKKWSTEHTPNPAGALYGELDGVSCTSAAACTAVGDYEKHSNRSRTLAERWNGKRWTIQRTLNPTTNPNKYLYGVSCTGPRDCIAAGYTSPPRVWHAKTLVERWNGHSWSVERSPNPATDNDLNGVSCSSTSTCTAVGWYQKGSGPQKTLVEHR